MGSHSLLQRIFPSQESNPGLLCCRQILHRLSYRKIHLQCWRPGFDPWVGKIPWRRERLPTPVFWPGEFHGLYSPWGRKESDTTERLSLSLLGFPGGSAGKESSCSAGDLGSIPGLERSPGEGKGYPLQYSGLENPVDCILKIYTAMYEGEMKVKLLSRVQLFAARPWTVACQEPPAMGLSRQEYWLGCYFLLQGIL